MATVLLVRHGRTTANAAGILAGRAPGVRLDDVGRAQAERTAERLAAGPTRSLGLSKVLLNSTFETTLAESLDREGQAQAMAAMSPEMAEGMAAFKERRAPDFPGLS